MTEEQKEDGWVSGALRTAKWPLLMVGSLALLHLAGARQAAVVLSGTAPPGLLSVVGLVYVMLWLLCVVLLPPWLCGSLLTYAGRKAHRRLLGRR